MLGTEAAIKAAKCRDSARSKIANLRRRKLTKIVKKINKIGLAGFILASGVVAPSLMADTVVLSNSAFSYSDGGEFTAVTTPTLADLSAYSPYTSTSDSFQTFCVQVSTEFYEGTTYNYTVSSVSLGAPGLGSGGAVGGVGNANSYPLSEGAAWLYSQFALGTLAGYDFANTLNDRQTEAGILQSAIWALQGGQVDGS